MKKTISILCGLTILSACGTDNNKALNGRHAPELNSAQAPSPSMTNPKAPQARLQAAQSNKYTSMPFLGNSLIPAPPPVTQARVVPPAPPAQPVMVASASDTLANTGRRQPDANRNASGVASADLLGPAPSPAVTRTPLAPLPPMAAPPAPSGPVQKIQSVSLNMPKGGLIPPAPGKNAKALIEIPAQVAVVKPNPAPVVVSQQELEVYKPAPLQSVSANMPEGSVIPSAPSKSIVVAAPAPVKSVVVTDTAPLQSASANMPQDKVVPAAPAKTVAAVEPAPEVHDVAPLQSVASNMPQGQIFPPVPPVVKPPEPEIHEVEQLQPSSVIMPQGSYSVVPTTQVVETPAPMAEIAAPIAPIPAAAPAPEPKLAAAPVPEPKLANTQVVVTKEPVVNSVTTTTTTVTPVATAAAEPQLVGHASDANIAERIPVEVVPAPAMADNSAPTPPKPMTVASNSYDQFPNLADVPPAPPKPGPATDDPRVKEMQQDLTAMHSAAATDQIPVTAPSPVVDKPAVAAVAPAPTPTPAPVKAPEVAAPPPPPVVAAPPAPSVAPALLPKGPTIVVKADKNDATPVITPVQEPTPPPSIGSVSVVPDEKISTQQVQVSHPSAEPVTTTTTVTTVTAPAPKPLNAGPGKPAGFLVPPTTKTTTQTIHQGASTTSAVDNNFENVQPTSEDHGGYLPESRYEKARNGESY